MRTGVCRRCEARDVYAARNGLTEYRIGVRPQLEPGFQGVVVPHLTQDLWDFVCAACGYVETYLLDPAALEFVRRSWRRIEPQD